MTITYHLPRFGYHWKTTLHSALGRIRFRHLTLLSLLVELGSVRHAARRLNLTQPAVSRMVGDLEAAFDGSLFERTARGMTPNARALSLLRRSRVILKELEVAQDELHAPQPRPTIRVGAVSHVVQGLLPRVISSLESRAPLLRIRIRTATILSLLKAMQQGELDCVVGRLSAEHFGASDPGASTGPRLDPSGSDTSELQYEVLYDEPLCLVVGRRHPLARRRSLNWADLIGERWLLPPPEGLVYRLLTETFLNAGFRMPTPTIECDQYAFSIPIVAAANLITVVPISEARKNGKQVKVLPISTEISAPPLVLAFRKASIDLVDLGIVRQAIREAASAANERVEISSASWNIAPPGASREAHGSTHT